MPNSGPRGELSLRTVAMPADTNPNGDIFGGWIMSLMDLAAGVAAGTRAKGRVATAAVSNLNFLHPVRIAQQSGLCADRLQVVQAGHIGERFSLQYHNDMLFGARGILQRIGDHRPADRKRHHRARH
jgi:acyl-CoA thioesterase YciA